MVDYYSGTATISSQYSDLAATFLVGFLVSATVQLPMFHFPVPLVLLLLFCRVHALIAIAEQGSLRVAYCLTGQLARLEIISKIKHIFVPNAVVGHQVSVFAMLDGNVSDVKQTLYAFDYSNNPYSSYSAEQLNEFMVTSSTTFLDRAASSRNLPQIVYRTKYVSPPTRKYPVRGKAPVADKIINGVAGIELGADRFQKNMRWMAAVRDCVKWVQQVEYEQRSFFDVVVRLRDDSYALKDWLLTPASRYRNGLVSVNFGLHHGINDHNFVVARRWTDVLLRGMTEDYYFNETLDEFTWLNPEHRIAKVADSLGMPVHMNTLCMQPLLPLRGVETNITLTQIKNQQKRHGTEQQRNTGSLPVYWKLHPAYVEMAFDQCGDDQRKKLNDLAAELSKLGIIAADVLDASCCDKPWMQIISDGFVPLEPI
jgi:hypothetical protein